MEKQDIVLFEEKKDCCACGACMNICPKEAITMHEDEYGFIYPIIDQEKCVKCGMCKRVCAFQNIEEKNEPIATYVATSKNTKQKINSASGGIFAMMATYVLEKKGVVFGCALENQKGYFVSKHIAIQQKEELPKLQGSKYVQSAIGKTYKEVLAYLNEGKLVLYSGTPCQIAGLKGFLGKSYKNLLTVDLVCHGIPSERMFNDYMQQEMKNRNAIDIIDYSFRDKNKGWGENTKIVFLNTNNDEREVYIPARLSSYNTFFLDALITRENCYSCKYAGGNRPGDITLGDYWGIEDVHPELSEKDGFIVEDGISCVIVNSKNGEQFCEDLKQYCFMKKSDYTKAAKRNKQLNKPSEKPEKRDELMNIYRENGYQAIENLFKGKYKKQRIIHYCFNKMPRRFRNFVKKIIKK